MYTYENGVLEVEVDGETIAVEEGTELEVQRAFAMGWETGKDIKPSFGVDGPRTLKIIGIEEDTTFEGEGEAFDLLVKVFKDGKRLRESRLPADMVSRPYITVL